MTVVAGLAADPVERMTTGTTAGFRPSREHGDATIAFSSSSSHAWQLDSIDTTFTMSDATIGRQRRKEMHPSTELQRDARRRALVTSMRSTSADTPPASECISTEDDTSRAAVYITALRASRSTMPMAAFPRDDDARVHATTRMKTAITLSTFRTTTRDGMLTITIAHLRTPR